MIANVDHVDLEVQGGENMKKAKAIGSIFALPIMLVVKTCELIFVMPIKAIAKRGG